MTPMDHVMAALLTLMSLSLLFQKTPDIPDLRQKFYIAGAVSGLLTGGAVLLVWRFAGRPLEDFGLYDWWGDARITVAAALAWAALLLIGLFFTSRGFFRSWLNPIYARYDKLMPTNGRELAASWGTSVAAGCGEEIVYRGFFLWYVTAWLGLPAAIVLTSLLFGVAHGYQSRYGVVHATLAGLLMAGVYVASGSLLLVIWMHAVYNMASFTTGLILRQPVRAEATSG